AGWVGFGRGERLLGVLREGWKIRVVEVADGRACRLLSGFRGSMTFAPGERLLVNPDAEGVHFWDVTTGETVATLPFRGAGNSFFPGVDKGLTLVTSQAVYRCPTEFAVGPEGPTLRFGRPEALRANWPEALRQRSFRHTF